jgi:hypothetical protein
MQLCGYSELVRSISTCKAYSLYSQLNMENTILSQYRRLPGFHSEFVGLEVMDSSSDRIGFEDVLNGNFCLEYFMQLSSLMQYIVQTLESGLRLRWTCTSAWSGCWVFHLLSHFTLRFHISNPEYGREYCASSLAK